MVSSFGCGWHSGGVTQSLNCWSSCNVRGKMGVGGMVGDNGFVMEVVLEDGMQRLRGKFILVLMRAGILVGGVLVVVVIVMVVPVGMLMSARILVGGVVVVVLGIVCLSEEQCLFVTEVECWRVCFRLVGCDVFDFVWIL